MISAYIVIIARPGDPDIGHNLPVSNIVISRTERLNSSSATFMPAPSAVVPPKTSRITKKALAIFVSGSGLFEIARFLDLRSSPRWFQKIRLATICS